MAKRIFLNGMVIYPSRSAKANFFDIFKDAVGAVVSVCGAEVQGAGGLQPRPPLRPLPHPRP